jgi:Zn-dependent peptidase ImmA (M78 family)
VYSSLRLLVPSKLLMRTIQALKVGSLCDDHVEELANEFEVSEQAMAIRLSTLGFL